MAFHHDGMERKTSFITAFFFLCVCVCVCVCVGGGGGVDCEIPRKVYKE